jgi:hypothetical protein
MLLYICVMRYLLEEDDKRYLYLKEWIQNNYSKRKPNRREKPLNVYSTYYIKDIVNRSIADNVTEREAVLNILNYDPLVLVLDYISSNNEDKAYKDVVGKGYHVLNPFRKMYLEFKELEVLKAKAYNYIADKYDCKMRFLIEKDGYIIQEIKRPHDYLSYKIIMSIEEYENLLVSIKKGAIK